MKKIAYRNETYLLFQDQKNQFELFLSMILRFVFVWVNDSRVNSIFYIYTKQNYKKNNIILKLHRLRAMTFDKASQ